MSHTPLPWNAYDVPNDLDFAHEIEGVCAIYKGPNAQGNAQLFKAAPELLAVLHEAFSVLGEQELKDVFGYEWHGKARNAIVQATGEQP